MLYKGGGIPWQGWMADQQKVDERKELTGGKELASGKSWGRQGKVGEWMRAGEWKGASEGKLDEGKLDEGKVGECKVAEWKTRMAEANVANVAIERKVVAGRQAGAWSVMIVNGRRWTRRKEGTREGGVCPFTGIGSGHRCQLYI